LVLCAYTCYAGILCERTRARRLTAAILCGGFSAALGLAWEGVGLFTLVFAATLGWMAIQKQITREQLLLHLLWYVVAIPPLLLFSRAYRLIDQPYVILALLPLPCVCVGLFVVTLAAQMRWRPRTRTAYHGSPAPIAPGPPMAALVLGLCALGACFQRRLSCV